MRWRRSSSHDRHAPPVEMRFVDMFMAALGALIFMAMLLAFLVGQMRTRPIVPSPLPDTEDRQPIKLVTANLPPARAGEPYEVPFAYRGGRGPVGWKLDGGEVPTGMDFKSDRGLLTGTPKAAGIGRFVVKVFDKSEFTDVKGFELRIEPPIVKASKTWEKALAIGLMILLGLFSLAAFGGAAQSRKLVMHLKESYAGGQRQFSYQQGEKTITIKLPEGIPQHEAEAKVEATVGKFTLVLFLCVAAWFIWRVWF